MIETQDEWTVEYGCEDWQEDPEIFFSEQEAKDTFFKAERQEFIKDGKCNTYAIMKDPNGRNVRAYQDGKRIRA